MDLRAVGVWRFDKYWGFLEENLSSLPSSHLEKKEDSVTSFVLARYF